MRKKRRRGSGPGWWKEPRRHSEAAKQGWRTRKRGRTSKYSFRQLKKIQAGRATLSRLRDNILSHKRTVDSDDPYTKAWVNDQGSMDIKGIDAPGTQQEGKPSPTPSPPARPGEKFKERINKQLEKGRIASERVLDDYQDLKKNLLSRAQIWLKHAERPDKEKKRDEQHLHSHIVNENDPKDVNRWMKDQKGGGDVEGIDTPPYGTGPKKYTKGTGRQRGPMSDQEKREVAYIARTTNSSFIQAKALRNQAATAGYSYDEIDWDGIQGKDLTHAEKKRKLDHQINKGHKGVDYYSAMEHDRNVKDVKKAIREGKEEDVKDITQGHKKRPEPPSPSPPTPQEPDLIRRQRLQELYGGRKTATKEDLARDASYNKRWGSPHDMRIMIDEAEKKGELTRNPDGTYSRHQKGEHR